MWNRMEGPERSSGNDYWCVLGKSMMEAMIVAAMGVILRELAAKLTNRSQYDIDDDERY